jgi:phosphoglucosamine mutase
VQSSGMTLQDLKREIVVAPQVLVNVRTSRKEVIESPVVREAVARAQSTLDGSGRLLIRPSGTEPLIRVMVEGDDQEEIERIAGDLARQIEQAAATL